MVVEAWWVVCDVKDQKGQGDERLSWGQRQPQQQQEQQEQLPEQQEQRCLCHMCCGDGSLHRRSSLARVTLRPNRATAAQSLTSIWPLRHPGELYPGPDNLIF